MIDSQKDNPRGAALAISPPSDIVLDVARAADPSALEVARASLVRRGTAVAAAAGEAFSVLETSQPAPQVQNVRAAKEPDSLQRFEAMVLQTFIQSMMPEQTSAVYGQGMAGDIWKSMMAEKLAGVMAERGGIGIADGLLRDHYVVDERKIPIGPVSDVEARVDSDRQLMLSTSMIQEMQRKLARSIAEDAPAASVAAGT